MSGGVHAPAAGPLFSIEDWRGAYRRGQTPHGLLHALLKRLNPQDPAWISVCSAEQLDAQLRHLSLRDPLTSPLWGVPFAVKDNIDIAAVPTTAACPAFARTPAEHATAVQRLLDAGAVWLGKTNLDQFATGLVGTRSPYGAVPNTFDAAYVSGGSSSGSASVVARGLVPFALGTDTAGSGRVPAGFNNLVGLKPTPGRAGMTGVLPACKSLDVVSVFALTVGDAAQVAACIDGPDVNSSLTLAPQHPARFPAPLRIGVPRAPVVDAALGYDAAWQLAQDRAEALGHHLVPVDMQAFFEVAALLYDGPWVAERYAVVRELMETHPEALDATVRNVIAQARRYTAVDAFEGRYRLEALAHRIAPVWRDIDVLMLPTAPTHPTLAAVAAEPVKRNSELGLYTNFVNLLGLAALAVPAGFTASGLPFGVTFVGPGGSEAALAHIGYAWELAGLDGGQVMLGAGLRPAQPDDFALRQLPPSTPCLPVAVVGAHLEGLPLHGQLAERGCRLLARTRTAPRYRLHALPGTVPPKPGLARVADADTGHAIEVEVYDMPLEAVGSFLSLIPWPLGLGTVELADGRWVKGFICEPAALALAPDISRYGGWRSYLASLKGNPA